MLKPWLTYLPLITLLWTCTSPASVLNITAEYKPRITSPGNVDFVNTTPLSGYCRDHPPQCRPTDVTISFPLIIERTWLTPGPIEEHNYQRVDGTWKDVMVHSDLGGVSVPLRFRLNLLSRAYHRGVLQPGGIEGGMGTIGNLSGISGATVGGCRGRVGIGHGTMYTFAWEVAEDFTVCSRPSRNDIPFGPYAGSIRDVSIGYQLVAPSPLQLRNGTYRGAISYSLGEGHQIDLGRGQYSDSQLTINFELTV